MKTLLPDGMGGFTTLISASFTPLLKGKRDKWGTHGIIELFPDVQPAGPFMNCITWNATLKNGITYRYATKPFGDIIGAIAVAESVVDYAGKDWTGEGFNQILRGQLIVKIIN